MLNLLAPGAGGIEQSLLIARSHLGTGRVEPLLDAEPTSATAETDEDEGSPRL